MKTCAIVTAVAFLAGCSKIYEVPVENAASMRPNHHVTLASGAEVTLGDSYRVRALPYPDAVFVTSSDRPGFYWLGSAFEAQPGMKRVRATPWMGSPVRFVFDGPSLFIEREGTAEMQQLPIAGVRVVQVSQTDSPKTIAFVLGLSISAVLVGAIGFGLASAIPN